MPDYVYIIVIISLLLYIIVDETEVFTSRKKICNEIDGRCYGIVEKFDDIKQASELLARLNLFALQIMKHLREKYLWNNHPNEEARSIVALLLDNYNPDGIIENAPNSNVNTSYVDDKGRTFAICLREKLSGKNNFHSFEELQFVVLHEMAHMGNAGFGHGDDFWQVFKFLLHEASETGMYSPVNYTNTPMNYCSLIVDHNPYFDDTIRRIGSDSHTA
jgi:hypothetical protein